MHRCDDGQGDRVTNREAWNADSDHYQGRHASDLGERPLAWGVWRIPESELNVLGDVKGRDILEYGCGAAQWSIALAAAGARPVGVDLSDRQLVHARRLAREAGVHVPLIQADGELLPFGNASFDVIFCDHGAMTFGNPECTVAEAKRLLRPGGVLAFCLATPWLDVCWDSTKRAVTDRLVEDYFGLGLMEYDGKTYYQFGYGEWIRLFREHDFVVEDLIEIQAPLDQETTYEDFVRHEWARRWPAEQIWKVRKP